MFLVHTEICYSFLSGVGRKIRNLRLAYKKIWQRDGFNAKWRHFRNLAFLQSSSTNMDTEMNDREFQYEESCYEPPFVTLNCGNDELHCTKVSRSVLTCDASNRKCYSTAELVTKSFF